MSDLLNLIESLPDVTFIDNLSLEELLRDMINDYQNKYEELTESKISLSKADPNRLLLYACAVQIYQGFQFIDRAGKQDLLKYSYGDHLDNLAALKGVVRNNAQPAKVMIKFTLSGVRSSATPIPLGTRVAAGEVYFESIKYNEIPAGEIELEIEMVCTQDGVIGNGFLVGEINTLVDPIAYVSSVVNITTSIGGSEIESDESLAERTFLAPSSFSTAGPDDAYIYWTKTFSQNILDVSVSSPNPCEVDIRFILHNGELPNEMMITGLQNFLNDKKVRPLTDLVTVGAPEVVEYSISVTYWINKSVATKAVTIQNEVIKAVSNYIEWQNNKIGRDINPSELVRRMMEAGAKRVIVNTPEYTVINDNAIAKLVEFETLYGGIEND